MNNPFRWISRNFWWLITAISFTGACMRIATAAIDGTKVSAGELIFWVAIAAMWMVIQFMAEWRARRAERELES